MIIPFTLTFLSGLFLSIITFWGLGYMISFLPKEQVKTDIFWIVLISIALATISMWISLLISYQEIPMAYFFHSNNAIATGGFPLIWLDNPANNQTIFEICSRFSFNYLFFVGLYFFPLFYTGKDYNLATLFTKKQYVFWGLFCFITNLLGGAYIFFKIWLMQSYYSCLVFNTM